MAYVKRELVSVVHGMLESYLLGFQFADDGDRKFEADLQKTVGELKERLDGQQTEFRGQVVPSVRIRMDRQLLVVATFLFAKSVQPTLSKTPPQAIASHPDLDIARRRIEEILSELQRTLDVIRAEERGNQ